MEEIASTLWDYSFLSESVAFAAVDVKPKNLDCPIWGVHLYRMLHFSI